MKIFHGRFYRYTLKALRYTLLFLFKKQIIKDMVANDYWVSDRTTVKWLYQFWFEEHRYLESCEAPMMWGTSKELKTIVFADSINSNTLQ